MQRWLLKSKLHRGRVTDTDVAYAGSITIDETLLDAADIAVGERVQVLNVTNGERFETYTIAGDSGEIEINGAAARRAEVGDVVIVISYGLYEDDERTDPTVLTLDADNEIAD